METRLRLTARQFQTLRIYFETKATHGRRLSDQEARDPILATNLSVIDRVYRRCDQDDLAEQIAERLAKLTRR